MQSAVLIGSVVGKEYSMLPVLPVLPVSSLAL